MNVIRGITSGNALFNAFSKVFTFGSARSSATPKIFTIANESLTGRTFTSLTTTTNSLNLNRINLTPSSVSVVPSCGIRIRGRLQLRCKGCYYARVDGRMMVLCDIYPRHKQYSLVKNKKYTWILTHCSQSKYRPY